MKRIPRKIKKIAKLCYMYGTTDEFNHDEYDYNRIIHNYPKHGVLFLMIIKKEPYCKLIIKFGKNVRLAYNEGMFDF